MYEWDDDEDSSRGRTLVIGATVVALAALGWFVVRPVLSDDEAPATEQSLTVEDADSTTPGSNALASATSQPTAAADTSTEVTSAPNASHQSHRLLHSRPPRSDVVTSESSPSAPPEYRMLPRLTRRQRNWLRQRSGSRTGASTSASITSDVTSTESETTDDDTTTEPADTTAASDHRRRHHHRAGRHHPASDHRRRNYH